MKQVYFQNILMYCIFTAVKTSKYLRIKCYKCNVISIIKY